MWGNWQNVIVLPPIKCNCKGYLNDDIAIQNNLVTHHQSCQLVIFFEFGILSCLWSPSYFVGSTGQVSTDVVKHYIETQRSA